MVVVRTNQVNEGLGTGPGARESSLHVVSPVLRGRGGGCINRSVVGLVLLGAGQEKWGLARSPGWPF